MPHTASSDPPPSAAALTIVRGWLTRTAGGWTLVAGALIKFAAFAVRLIIGRSDAIELLSNVGDLALIAGAVLLAWRVLGEVRRVVLWRVRRKLTVSYIFIGFVPVLLVIAFFLICGVLVFNSVSAYVIRNRIGEVVRETRLLAEIAAADIERARSLPDLEATLARREQATAARYPGVSYALMKNDSRCGSRPRALDTRERIIVAGSWPHMPPPETAPTWIPCAGAAALVVYALRRADDAPELQVQLVARALVWPNGLGAPLVVDVPIMRDVTMMLRTDTGIELGALSVVGDANSVDIVPGTARPQPDADATADTPAGEGSGVTGILRRQRAWVALLDPIDWTTGRSRALTANIHASIAAVYERIAPDERAGNFTFSQMLLTLLAVIAALFLVIQGVAFVMGLALARSITGSVHELFTGTERVRHGDFTHKIAIRSRDQLGELAQSFNSMTASIEDLLEQQAEKERLEHELRTARAIQMSLLPRDSLAMAGLSVMAHCEPAREVGGDYYDYLPLDDHRLGVLIADVSGKGTSAALYMAELKGLMLSLTQLHTSPRRLLIDANRIISKHLDARSFITITYAVIDLEARTFTYARAGHCPLIYVPGPYAAVRTASLMIPDGLVLGLQIDNGELFEHLLEEATIPLGPGDLFLLYTDGITEAMNAEGDCFGETRLADIAARHASGSFEELRERILREVQAFVGPVGQHDDMTMLLLKVDEVPQAACS